MSRWIGEAYKLGNEWATDTRPACYVVYLDGELAYIGQTANYRKRMLRHNVHFNYDADITTPWGRAKGVIVKRNHGCKFGDWAMRELRLIRRLKPRANRVGNSPRSEVCYGR